MTRKFDKLNETFNIDSSDIVTVNESKIEEALEITSKISTNDIKRDYEYARGNLYSLIEKGQEAINGILELAQEGGKARDYEVAGQLIKNTSEVAEKLMGLQKTLKDIEEDKSLGPTTVNNALFIGSTAELTKLLKQQTLNKIDT